MSYNVSAQDVSVLGQKVKEYKLKIELLNSNMQVIDILTGDCLSCSYTIDSTSDIRRTISFSMIVKDSKYTIDSNSRIWLNRYLKVSLGIKTLRTQEVLYYPIGLFMPESNNFSYDISTRLLDVQAVDLMNLYINTKLGGTTSTVIPAGSNIRNAIIAVIQQISTIKKYNIAEVCNILNSENNTVPYDLNFTNSDSLYDVISELRDLYVGWESFFDMDTFVVQQISTGINDNIVLDYETIINKHLCISEQISNDFDEIYNVTEIFGEQIEPDYYTEECTNDDNIYYATIEGIDSLAYGSKYAIKLNTSNNENQMLNINNYGSYPIVDDDGNAIPANTISDYMVFQWKNEKFYLLGNYQVHAVCILRSENPTDEEKQQDIETYNCENIVYRISPNNEFTIEKIGIRKDVKSGDDYSNIYSNSLAIQRAKYENWKSTRLNNQLTLEIQSIFWLDVNQKITYKSKIDNEVRTWIITKITCDDALSGIMQIEATEFFPTYPETYE